jgi:SAM-dependent methyltransferase
MMPEKDKNTVIERYSNRYKEHGYSPKTLGWDKGKQDLRYSMLFSEFDLRNKSILDIGCGFGDANKLLKAKAGDYHYLGIDLVGDLIKEAKKRYAGEKHIEFMEGDFLDLELEGEYDIIVASGVFNFKLFDGDNYDFIQSFLEKAFSLARVGVAFDFLSDKVDYQYEHTFHSDPAKILIMGYALSRNIVLRNDYMPFEFCMTVFKDDSFSADDTIFTRFKNEKEYYRFY